MTKPDPERIWLEPACCADPREGRLWCEDNQWPSSDCDAQAEATEYLRVDRAAARERAAVLEAHHAIADWHDEQAGTFRALAERLERLRVQPGDIERARWASASHAAHATAIRRRPIPTPHALERSAARTTASAFRHAAALVEAKIRDVITHPGTGAWMADVLNERAAALRTEAKKADALAEHGIPVTDKEPA